MRTENLAASAYRTAQHLPDIYEYLSYRQFLREAYENMKSAGAIRSQGQFAERLGLSRNLLKFILDGDRAITPEKVVTIANGLGLVGKRLSYFEALVAFGNSRSAETKAYHLERLGELRGLTGIQGFDLSQFRALSQWHLPVIRELLGIVHYQEHPEQIAEALRPRLSRADFSEAISILKASGLIEERGGRLVQRAAYIQTDPELRSIAIRNYHRMALKRSALAVQDRPDTREFGSLTFTCNPQSLPKLKEKIREFRKSILEIVRHESAHDRVYQLNLQLFNCLNDEETE